MRLSIATAACVLVLAAPASADEPAVCAIGGPGPLDYQRELIELVRPVVNVATGEPSVPAGGGEGVAAAVLGEQFGSMWFSTRLQGWAVGLGPGPLDAEQARVAIGERIRALIPEPGASILVDRLRIVSQPYTDAQLEWTREQATMLVHAEGLMAVAWIGCSLSDARRVELTVDAPVTPELEARLRTLLEPFGDAIRFQIRPGSYPRPLGGVVVMPPATSFVVAPRTTRCIRGGTVGFRVRKPVRLHAVKLTAGGRTVTAKGRALRKRVAIRLKGRRTTVTLTVTLGDSVSISQKLIYRRCSYR